LTGEEALTLSIVNVANVVADGCTDHTAKDPPVGPTVDDLATALTRLEPFDVTVPPRDVEIDGYRGTYLELSLADIASEQVVGNDRFSDCDSGEVHSWMSAPVTSFWGYFEVGQVDAYWILDVDGKRLVISSSRTPNASAADVAEPRPCSTRSRSGPPAARVPVRPGASHSEDPRRHLLRRRGSLAVDASARGRRVEQRRIGYGGRRPTGGGARSPGTSANACLREHAQHAGCQSSS
jgi:hypothetical protein